MKSFATFDSASFKDFIAIIGEVSSKIQAGNDVASIKWHEKVELERTTGRAGRSNEQVQREAFRGRDDSSNAFLTRSMTELLNM